MINKKPYDNWQETTLRKGTKNPKICKDMFIADSNGSFTFCEVKNGQLVNKKPLEKDVALNLISSKNLVAVPDSIFRNCKTYRTATSNKLIANLFSQITLEKAATDCRKFKTVLPEPFTHKL